MSITLNTTSFAPYKQNAGNSRVSFKAVFFPETEENKAIINAYTNKEMIDRRKNNCLNLVYKDDKLLTSDTSYWDKIEGIEGTGRIIKTLQISDKITQDALTRAGIQGATIVPDENFRGNRSRLKPSTESPWKLHNYSSRNCNNKEVVAFIAKYN